MENSQKKEYFYGSYGVLGYGDILNEGPFNSVEDCIKDAVKKNHEKIKVGYLENFDTNIDSDDIYELFFEKVENEQEENYVTCKFPNLSKEKSKELGEKINNVLQGFLIENSFEIKVGILKDVKEYDIDGMISSEAKNGS